MHKRAVIRFQLNDENCVDFGTFDVAVGRTL